MKFAVYLASPIDYASGVRSEDVAIARGQLLNHDCIVFDPGRAWYAHMTDPDPLLMTINKAVIWNCHGVLAVLPPHALTVGTVLEIKYAADHGKPVAVVGKPGWGFAHIGVPVYDGPVAAVAGLLELMGG